MRDISHSRVGGGQGFRLQWVDRCTFYSVLESHLTLWALLHSVKGRRGRRVETVLRKVYLAERTNGRQTDDKGNGRRVKYGERGRTWVHTRVAHGVGRDN